MGSVTVHTVGTARGNYPNFWHSIACLYALLMRLNMRHGMAYLHGTGVGSQEMATFHIKGVVHGTSWVILRRVQSREVEPIGFYFRPLGDRKTHGGKDRLNALQTQTHRMQTTLAAQATGQTDVKFFCLELLIQLFIRQSLSAGIQGLFNRLLGQIDDRALGLFGVQIELGQALHHLGNTTRFTQELCLGVF